MGNASQTGYRVGDSDKALFERIRAKGPCETLYDVNFEHVLGRGHYATVNLAKDKRTGKQVAIKRIAVRASRLEALKAEVEILARVGHHPNIVEMFDMFITQDEVQIAMELLEGGELFDRMIEKGPYSEYEASKHVGKIGSALKYLHSKGIVHRDLKPENLMLVDKSSTSDVKIADFGLSKIVDDIEFSTMQTVCGTWAYAAPEVKTSLMEGKANYTAKVDLWSTGVILFVILSAYHPFDPDGDADDNRLWGNICKGKFNFEDEAWEHISDGAKDLINKLVVVDPEVRYGTEELLDHPWVTRALTPVPKTPIAPNIDKKMSKYQEKRAPKYHARSSRGSVASSSVFSGTSNQPPQMLPVGANARSAAARPPRDAKSDASSGAMRDR